jgi:predicted transcriptional regulator of viral defense system/very-short-patch-repair endonuclease
MRRNLRTHRLAALAAKQHGVVATRQLLQIGFTERAISHAAASGRLHRTHRGVYAVGHTQLTAHGHQLAAVLACGREAVLSHGSAAWLWDLSPTRPSTPHVTVPHRGHGRRSIRVHHAPGLAATDRGLRESIPVTSIARTLLDLAAVASRQRIERLVEAAERSRALDLRHIEPLLSRAGGHRGAARLRSALALYNEPEPTRSDWEGAFLDLVRAASLPPPAVNARINGYEVDFLWRAELLVVELDSWGFHRTRAAFERDRLRDDDLRVAGVEVVRLTWRRMQNEPDVVTDRLRRMLARRRDSLGA